MIQYIVDAFADKLFCGNQAAVCVLEKWISETLMQNIAKENNFSETAFTVKNDDSISDAKPITFLSVKKQLEIDFVANKTQKHLYIQSALSMRIRKKLR